MSGTQIAPGTTPAALHKHTHGAPKVEGVVTTDAQIAAMRAEAKAEGVREGAEAARAAERERMSAILDSDEAAGREALARHFAFESDLSAEVARSALAKAPKAEAAKPATPNRFDAAMAAAGNPQVGLEPPAASQSDGVAFADSYFAAKRQKRSA